LGVNPATETRAAAGRAKPEHGEGAKTVGDASPLRQRLGQKAKQALGACACLRREFSGEPDAGNLHLRFDEGRAGRGSTVALSPTLPARYREAPIPSRDHKGAVGPETSLSHSVLSTEDPQFAIRNRLIPMPNKSCENSLVCLEDYLTKVRLVCMMGEVPRGLRNSKPPET
jgi:hypothetical protein